MKKHGFLLLGVALAAIILIYFAVETGKNRGNLVFQDNLDAVAVTVDGEDITLGDLTFYVLFEEQKVEEQALIYNPDSTKDYWNTHTNGQFTQLTAKKTVLEMAIHDKIMSGLAAEAHVVLNSEQKDALEKARTKFWSSLFEGQLEKLPYDYEEGNRKIREIAIIEAFEHALAETYEDVTFAGLAWDGYDYGKIKEDHKIKIHSHVWDRIAIGDISLTHDNVNYINGLTDKEKEELQEKIKNDRLKP